MHVHLINVFSLLLTIAEESHLDNEVHHSFMQLLCKRSADIWAKSKSGYVYERWCLYGKNVIKDRSYKGHLALCFFYDYI